MADAPVVTVDDVLTLGVPTDRFLVPLSANAFKIDFLAFKIRAVQDGHETCLFEISKDPDDGPELDDTIGDDARMIKYHFGPRFLDFPTIGTNLEFTIGEIPLHNFRMIERHYFGDQLIKCYDFTLPFVIPNTRNTWEVIYTMPEMDPALKQAIIENPYATCSDSFYFVEDRLVMHNKAWYDYSEGPGMVEIREEAPMP